MTAKNTAKVTFANRPPNKGSLNILTLDTAAAPEVVGPPAISSSPAIASESSWDGLAVPQDSKMQSLMGKSWFDITPSPFGVGSPAFPTGTPKDTQPQSDEAFKEVLQQEQDREEESVPSATSTPPGATAQSLPIETPTKRIDSEGDEPEPFLDEPEATGMERAATSTSQSSYSAQQQQEQSAPLYVANHELSGWVPFLPYDSAALQTELPSAQMVGAEERRGQQHHHRDPHVSKLFFGHLWSRLPTGCLQWLLNKLCAGRHEAYGAQLHFNRDGWFKGCLHVSIRSDDPQEIIRALHKRVLFDHSGVWYAETPEQKNILEEYCRRLRGLTQPVRHQKLQSLPCNPMACEFAQNE